MTPTFYHFFYHLKWHHHLIFYISFLINLYPFTLAQEIKSIFRAWTHFGLIFTYQPSHHFHPNFSNLIRSFSLLGLFLFTHQASTHERKKQFHFDGGSTLMAKLGLPFPFPIFSQIFIFFIPSFPPTKPTTKETSHTRLLQGTLKGAFSNRVQTTKQPILIGGFFRYVLAPFSDALTCEWIVS